MPGQPKKNAPAQASSKSGYGLGLVTKAFELKLPSGNTCLAVRPGAQGLIKAGLLDSLDQLTSLVQVEHIDSKDPKKMQAAVASLANNTDKVSEGLELIDQAVAFVVKEPKVCLPEYELDEDGEPIRNAKTNRKIELPRDPNLLYADEVDLEDKMFIFNWSVGGTQDLAQFRKESEAMLGSFSAS